jgi:uncharacterized protein YccT (UPF0319 family)
MFGLQYHIGKLNPQKARQARNAVLVAIVCIMAAQGLIIHLLALSISAHDEFSQGLLKAETEIVSTHQVWKQKVKAILNLSVENNTPEKPSSSSNIVVTFNLFVEKIGIEIPSCHFDELEHQSLFSYINFYHRLHKQKIPHPPQRQSYFS